ncbi:MAG: bifunctional glutamate N-acetyltransferase/amino-acid acetyltransferase ArgJ [Clostridia bacterium]|nr:bifunctional glutamate N-acetyltransferase/amino-acid acetyltransferase ArgJ [Clostridia bacterium]
MYRNQFIHQQIEGGVTAPQGFRAAGVAAGIKKNGNKDLAILVSDVPANAAGVFTTNKVKAAPLLVTMENLQGGKAQAVVVNAGNANACTGQQGLDNARATIGAVRQALNVEEAHVLVTSTGVIGVQLPMEKVLSGVGQAVKELSYHGGSEAAEAIMTTDTFPKELAITLELGDQKVTIGAMAKGSGMIHPNMATMLGFITTDAAISSDLLYSALRETTEKSFNMVSVDGDTSTNDMVVILANGLAGNKEITAKGDDYIKFKNALEEVCIVLAKAIARDGEGATKLVEIRVLNAPSDSDAIKAAKAIATSSLVKTAIFGSDANWGRIICAAGYSGADFDPNRVDIFLGDEKMAQDGCGLDFSEERAREILEQEVVVITVDLKIGEHKATAWGCDLTYDYVKINGAYRT